MRVIVDANIVFSGILNSNGKIGDILINHGKSLTMLAPEFLRTEIFRLYPKLSKISGMSLEQLRLTEMQICKEIKFISEEQISPRFWGVAEKLVNDIDPNDTHYIAYLKHFRCKIWSGEKHLMKGLRKKGFINFITTDELYELLQLKKTSSK